MLAAVVAACTTEDATGGPRLRSGTSRRENDGGKASSADDGSEPDDRDGSSEPEPGEPYEPQPDAGKPSEPTVPEESGEATYYDAHAGGGACGIAIPADYLVAAINDEQYSAANCGRCASVTGPNGKVVVVVADKCPGCGPGDLDLSEEAFVKIANKSAGRVKITWRFVPCP